MNQQQNEKSPLEKELILELKTAIMERDSFKSELEDSNL
jgi:hypothetical protein